MSTKILINGFFGKMGQAIYQESLNIDDAAVVAGCDVVDKSIDGSVIEISQSLTKIKTSFDVVIDFSLAATTIDIVTECADLNKPLVIGTTGHNKFQLSEIEKCSSSIPILHAPNMSIGVNASLLAIAEIAKKLKSYTVHIKEIHHKEKLDSPSGTALKIANVICNSREQKLGDITSTDCPVKFTSIRKDVVIGTHEVTFKGNNDSVTITHVANDRSIFASGSLKTAIWLNTQKPGFYNFNDFMKSIS